MNEPLEPIPLAELIRQIKADLLQDPSPRRPGEPLFFVDAVEVTAQVVARRERGEGGKAGLSLSVLGLKAGADIDTKTTKSNELAQSVTIKLSPLLSREELLQRYTEAERDKLAETAAKGVLRGGGGDAREIA